MIDLYSTIETHRLALVEDAQLQTNSEIWYGKSLSVFVDHDRDNPPNEDDAPTLQFGEIFKRASGKERTETIGYELTAVVVDDGEVVHGDGGKEFAGTERLIWIIERALTVIRLNKPTNSLPTMTYMLEIIEFYPTMVAFADVQFDRTLTIGENPFS